MNKTILLICSATMGLLLFASNAYPQCSAGSVQPRTTTCPCTGSSWQTYVCSGSSGSCDPISVWKPCGGGCWVGQASSDFCGNAPVKAQQARPARIESEKAQGALHLVFFKRDENSSIPSCAAAGHSSFDQWLKMQLDKKAHSSSQREAPRSDQRQSG